MHHRKPPGISFYFLWTENETWNDSNGLVMMIHQRRGVSGGERSFFSISEKVLQIKEDFCRALAFHRKLPLLVWCSHFLRRYLFIYLRGAGLCWKLTRMLSLGKISSQTADSNNSKLLWICSFLISYFHNKSPGKLPLDSNTVSAIHTCIWKPHPESPQTGQTGLRMSE